MLILIITNTDKDKYSLNNKEYEHWERIFFSNGRIFKTHHTNIKFNCSKVYEQFKKCQNYWDYDKEIKCIFKIYACCKIRKCYLSPEIITEEKLAKLAEELKVDLKNLIEIIKDNKIYKFNYTQI